MAIAINELGTWRRRALIVDDSRLAAAMLRRMLEREGFEVEWTGSPGAALGRLRQDRPDVVFLDHWMEGLCGLDVLSLIKSNPSMAGVPVVMFTSMESRQYNEDALAWGAFAVLPKRADAIDIPHLLDRLGLRMSAPLPEPARKTALTAAVVTPLPTGAGRRIETDGARTRVEAVPSPKAAARSIEPVVDRRCASLRRAERIWRPALLGIAATLVLAIWTVLMVLMASLHDRGYTSDELVMRDQAIAAASSSAAVATVSDLVDVSAIGNR